MPRRQIGPVDHGLHPDLLGLQPGDPALQIDQPVDPLPAVNSDAGGLPLFYKANPVSHRYDKIGGAAETSCRNCASFGGEADACSSHYDDQGRLPGELRRGPRILRTYRADGTLDYEHIAEVPMGKDVEPMIRKLLDEPEVARIHVRPVLSQCFLYEVTRAR